MKNKILNEYNSGFEMQTIHVLSCIQIPISHVCLCVSKVINNTDRLCIYKGNNRKGSRGVDIFVIRAHDITGNMKLGESTGDRKAQG